MFLEDITDCTSTGSVQENPRYRGDVSRGTSDNVQMGADALIFLVSKGKNAKSGGNLAKSLFKSGKDGLSKSIDDLADNITDINKKFSNGSTLNKGGLKSALNSASYYDDIGDQASSIFKSITGQLFMDGSKRTATEFITNFAKESGLKLKLDNKQLQNLATELAKGAKHTTEELTKMLFEK